MNVRRSLALLFALSAPTLACAKPGARTGAAPSPAPSPALRSIALPGAGPDGAVMLDYLAYDPAHHRVWVPAGNSGRVDVIETGDGRLEEVKGFVTAEVTRHETKRVVGPSSAT